MSERNQGKQDRTSRESETRESSERAKSWAPPALLPTPPDTEDWVYRWVRVSMLGESDTRNASMRFREGWEPVKAEDYPDLKVVPDKLSAWSEKGAIEVGGLLLCKAPREMREARQRYHAELAESQMEAIDNNYMRESDSRMPVLAPDRKSRNSFGGR